MIEIFIFIPKKDISDFIVYGNNGMKLHTECL